MCILCEFYFPRGSRGVGGRGFRIKLPKICLGLPPPPMHSGKLKKPSDPSPVHVFSMKTWNSYENHHFQWFEGNIGRYCQTVYSFVILARLPFFYILSFSFYSFFTFSISLFAQIWWLIVEFYNLMSDRIKKNNFMKVWWFFFSINCCAILAAGL